MGYGYAFDFLTGKVRTESVISWTGLKDDTNATFQQTIGHMYQSGVENIDAYSFIDFKAEDIEFDQRNVKPESLYDKFIVPHGSCRLYVGKPWDLMQFSLGDKSAEYNVFISDSAASNNFQVVCYVLCCSECKILWSSSLKLLLILMSIKLKSKSR